MGKKKNLQKRHKFKHVEAQPGISGQADNQTQVAVESKPSVNGAVRQPIPNGQIRSGAAVRDFSYVKSDLRRIGIMAVSLVALELGLYYLLVHTPMGNTIYSLVKV